MKTSRGKRLTFATVDDRGVVLEVPASLAQQASEAMGAQVGLDEYALARVLRSEAGSRSVAEKQAIAWVARNDADDLGWSITTLATYHNTAYRDDHFGKQISGRYASGSDPYEQDLMIARAVLIGELGDNTNGAVKFVHKGAFGVQEGTGSYADLLQKWGAEGLAPATVDGAADDFVVFRRIKK
jgi:hypothetical protein